MPEPAAAGLAAMHGELAALTAELSARWKVPGVLVGAIHGSEELLLAHGVSDAMRNGPLHADTVFPFASLSKVVTGTTVLAAVAAGALDLDEPLGRIDRVAEWDRVDLTLRDLLSHTTGWTNDDVGDHGDGDDVLRRAMGAVARLRVDPATRRHWSYSNAAMTTAAYVLERRMAQPYERLARSHVLEPLGMRASSFIGEPGPAPVDRGHVLEAGRPVPSQSGGFWAMNPYGGLSGTMGDLLRLARAHLTAYPDMRTPQSRSPGSHEAAGLAWWVRDVDGTPVVSHGGRAPGHMPLLVLVPSHQFAIAIDPNCGGSDAARLSHEIAAWALDRHLGLHETPPPGAEIDGRELVGRYARDGAIREISARAGAIELREWRERDQPPENGWVLAGVAADQAVVREGPIAGLRIEFLRGPDGCVTALRFERTGLGWALFGGRLIPRAS